MDLNQIFELIRQYGDAAYAFVFAYAASNSLLVVLFAGYAAQMGAFEWGKLVLVCWAGSIVGDAVRFWIGRRFGTRWLKSFPRIERAVQTTARLVDRHGLWIAFIYRFPNGIRGVAGFAYGVSQIPKPTFHILNILSAGIWSLAIVSAGYGFGHVSEKTLSETASGVSFAAMILFGGLFWLLARQLERAIERS